MSIEDVIFTFIVVALGLVPLLAIRRVEERDFKTAASFSWFAHILAGVGQIALYQYYYKAGDALAYGHYGIPVAEAMRREFGDFFPEVMKLFLQREYLLPFELVGTESTGSMQAVAIFLLFFLGNSLYAASVAVALASFVAKYIIYRGLKSFVPARGAYPVFLAVMLTPSVVFWTSTILKEPVAWVFFAPGFFALSGLVQLKNVSRNAVIMVASLFLTALIKPYLSMIFVVAGSAWLAWSRMVRSGRGFVATPLTLVGAAVLLVVGLTLSQRLFPKLNTDNLGESVSEKRRVMDKGGSGYDLGGDSESAGSTSMARQIALAPVGLVTALYRPFIFEARNPVQLFNAFETTALLVLTFQVLRRGGLVRVRKVIMEQPVLLFCLLFVVLLSLATSLSTSNLGTLSRYRAPMVPFFVVLLLRLQDRSGETEPSVAPVVDHQAA